MLPEGPKSSENLMSLPTDTMQVRVPFLMAPSSDFCPSQLHVDQIMPGIYLTNTSEAWTPERLRSHGFTHVINIDRHIEDFFIARNDHNCNRTCDFGSEFETLDLNFGEKSYLTTVLPNCYKAVKFIDKALQNGGAILVIDCNSNQKCLTIVTAYLMYKNNINFNDAFQRIKGVFKKAELERFFISQLYEYEPILQVQRAQARGNSCSRELRSAFLKRKKLHDDSPSPNECSFNHPSNHIHISSNNCHDSGDIAME